MKAHSVSFTVRVHVYNESSTVDCPAKLTKKKHVANGLVETSSYSRLYIIIEWQKEKAMFRLNKHQSVMVLNKHVKILKCIMVFFNHNMTFRPIKSDENV